MCGNNAADQSARLEVYEDDKSANIEGSMIWKIMFTDVKNVSHTQERQKEIITIRIQGDNKSVTFYADSQQSTMKWYKCCVLLFKIPRYSIPEMPKENIALQQAGVGQCDAGVLSIAS